MRHADQPVAEERIHVAAPPEQVWAFVSDIAFVVGASEELQAVRWCTGDGAAPSVGRQFVGSNANRYFGQWETTSTVIECDEPAAFAWAVGDVEQPSTTWRFELHPGDAGTLLTQQVRLGTGRSGLSIAIERMPDKEERIVERRMAEFRAALRANLEAVKAAAESR